jgi:hypothetical protein
VRTAEGARTRSPWPAAYSGRRACGWRAHRIRGPPHIVPHPIIPPNFHIRAGRRCGQRRAGGWLPVAGGAWRAACASRMGTSSTSPPTPSCRLTPTSEQGGGAGGRRRDLRGGRRVHCRPTSAALCRLTLTIKQGGAGGSAGSGAGSSVGSGGARRAAHAAAVRAAGMVPSPCSICPGGVPWINRRFGWERGHGQEWVGGAGGTRCTPDFLRDF